MSEVSLTLGLEAELGQALLLYNIENIVRRSGDQEMLSLLLSPHLLSALLDCPSAGVSLVSTLTRLLLLLSSSQLNTLLHNMCPARRDLQILLSLQQAENSEELVQMRRSVLELFIVSCLSLVQRKVECGQLWQAALSDHQLGVSQVWSAGAGSVSCSAQHVCSAQTRGRAPGCTRDSHVC